MNQLKLSDDAMKMVESIKKFKQQNLNKKILSNEQIKIDTQSDESNKTNVNMKKNEHKMNKTNKLDHQIITQSDVMKHLKRKQGRENNLDGKCANIMARKKVKFNCEDENQFKLLDCDLKRDRKFVRLSRKELICTVGKVLSNYMFNKNQLTEIKTNTEKLEKQVEFWKQRCLNLENQIKEANILVQTAKQNAVNKMPGNGSQVDVKYNCSQTSQKVTSSKSSVEVVDLVEDQDKIVESEEKYYKTGNKQANIELSNARATVLSQPTTVKMPRKTSNNHTTSQSLPEDHAAYTRTKLSNPATNFNQVHSDSMKLASLSNTAKPPVKSSNILNIFNKIHLTDASQTFNNTTSNLSMLAKSANSFSQSNMLQESRSPKMTNVCSADSGATKHVLKPSPLASAMASSLTSITKTAIFTCLDSGTNFQHPSPLPQFQPQKETNLKIVKLIPPKPILKVTKVDGAGFVLVWNLILLEEHENLLQYQVFVYEETGSQSSSLLWKRLTTLVPMKLPMALKLKSRKNNTYHFAVCAIDIHKRAGPFSNVVSCAAKLSTEK